MRFIRLAALMLLVATAGYGQICNESFTLRATACPAGALDCTNKGSTLTHSELDDNIINTIDVCKPFDVGSTAVTIQGDWSWVGTLALDQTVAPTGEGVIAWDATNDEIEVGDNAGTQIFKPVNTWTNANFCTADTSNNEIDCGTAGALSDDDLSDDNPTALQNVSTINDGDFCQGNASSGFDCDVTTIDESDLDDDVVLDNASNTYTTGAQDFSSATSVTFAANEILSSEIATEVRSMYWPAGSMSSDGTQCGDATEVNLNSGPRQWTITCADNDSGYFHGQVVMPDSWNASTVTFELMVHHATTETITFAGDFQSQCKAAGETVNNTDWPTEGASTVCDVSITTANDIEACTTAAQTPSGTCAAGDMLWWRYNIDATNFSTNAANTNVLGVKMEYTSNIGD